jgi:hypothetical protein
MSSLVSDGGDSGTFGHVGVYAVASLGNAPRSHSGSPLAPPRDYRACSQQPGFAGLFRDMDSDMPNQDRRTHAAEAAEIALRSLIILPRDYPFLYFREYEGKESREILEKTWLEV